MGETIEVMLTRVDGRVNEIHNVIESIKKGELPICVQSQMRLTALEKKVFNGNGGTKFQAPVTSDSGAQVDFLRGLFSINNVSPSKIVAVAKIGRDLVFGAVLAYLAYRLLGGQPEAIGRREHRASVPSVSTELAGGSKS